MVATWITTGVAVAGLLIGVLNRHRIQQVHVLVNSNLKSVMDRLDLEIVRSSQLTDTLKDHDVVVPPRGEA